MEGFYPLDHFYYYKLLLTMAQKHWKKYREVAKLIEEDKKYSVEEAMALVKKVSYTKFVWTVEVHIQTAANPKYNDQIIRSTVVLPNGTGKSIRIAAFVSDDNIQVAKDAGADMVGNTEIISAIEAGNIDFDVLVATPDMMRDLAKVAKTLWPKGLMPSPKAGSVTIKVADTIGEIKKGRVEFRLDKAWVIHVGLGKTDFDDKKLVENFTVLLDSIQAAKPAWVKGKLIENISVAPTMGPGVEIEFNS